MKEISREYLKATVSSNVDPIYNKAVNHVNFIEHLIVLTVEAAGTVSGDQPLVEAKENSKYKTQRLAATGNILPVFTLRLAKEISREYLKTTVSSNVDPIYNKAVNHVNLIEHFNVLTVEAAGTVKGDQPLADVAREVSDTGTDDSQTSIIKSRSQMVLARIN